MNMRLAAGVAALMLIGGPAIAADIPPMAPIAKAPVMVAKPSWYGFYIGVHGGYGWGSEAVTFAPDAFYAPAFAPAPGGFPTSAAGDPKGFLAGISWGSNWQFDRVVIGTDSDFSYSDIKDSSTATGTIGGLALTTTATQNLKWFGTTKLRGGILVTDDILLYATGGLATGRGESTFTLVGTTPFAGGCAVCTFGSGAKNLWGWAVGGGIEFGSGPWQFRAEYLHYDLGTLSYLAFDPAIPGAAINVSTKFSGDIARGAITYRFNWTPWELLFGR